MSLADVFNLDVHTIHRIKKTAHSLYLHCGKFSQQNGSATKMKQNLNNHAEVKDRSNACPKQRKVQIAYSIICTRESALDEYQFPRPQSLMKWGEYKKRRERKKESWENTLQRKKKKKTSKKTIHKDKRVWENRKTDLVN